MGVQERGRRQILNTVGSVALIGFAAFPSIACSNKDAGVSILHPAQAVEQNKTERFRSLNVPFEIQYPTDWKKNVNSPMGPTGSLDSFLGPEIDGINPMLSIRTETIPSWVEIEDYFKNKTSGAAPGEIQPLTKANDKNIPDGLKRFEDIKLGGKPTIGTYFSDGDPRPTTVKKIYYLVFYFVSDVRTDKDTTRRAWMVNISYPGALGLPENKQIATSTHKDFYGILNSFKLLQ